MFILLTRDGNCWMFTSLVTPRQAHTITVLKIILKNWNGCGTACMHPAWASGGHTSWLWFINTWTAGISTWGLPGSGVTNAAMNTSWHSLVSAGNFVHLATRKESLNTVNGCFPMCSRMCLTGSGPVLYNLAASPSGCGSIFSLTGNYWQSCLSVPGTSSKNILNPVYPIMMLCPAPALRFRPMEIFSTSIPICMPSFPTAVF